MGAINLVHSLITARGGTGRGAELLAAVEAEAAKLAETCYKNNKDVRVRALCRGRALAECAFCAFRPTERAHSLAPPAHSPPQVDGFVRRAKIMQRVLFPLDRHCWVICDKKPKCVGSRAPLPLAARSLRQH